MKVRDNAYKMALSDKLGVLTTFNVGDLSPYLKDNRLSNLRVNSLQPRKDDIDSA